MNFILESFSNDIIKIMNNNFPDYLRSSNSKFKKNIHKYKYWDLWLTDGTNSFNINNFKNEGLNKQQTYLYPTFSYPQNSVKLMGFSFLNYFPKYKLLHLDYISLDKNYQGKGNGTKYLNHIVETFYKNNKKVELLLLECEDHLIKFYEKNNFYQVKLSHYYFGTKLNLMAFNTIKKYQLLYYCASFLSNLFQHNKIMIKKQTSIIYKFLWAFYILIIIEGYKYHIFDNFKKN